MIRFLLLFCLLTVSLHTLAQQKEKYAVLLSKLPLVQAGEQKIARNNFGMMYKALLLQGFKEKNIRFDTSQLSQQNFYGLFESLKNEVRKGDFVLVYSDLPVSVHTFLDGSWDRGFTLQPKGTFIPASEWLGYLSDISQKTKEKDLFFTILETDWPAMMQDPTKKVKPVKAAADISVLQSGQMGQASVVKNDSSVFTKAVATVLMSGSNFMTGYEAFYNNVKKQVLMATAHQEPVLEAKKDLKLFNGLYKKLPLHFTVSNQQKDALMVNAGSALTFSNGDRVRFFKAFADTTPANLLGEGLISSISTLHSIVKMPGGIRLPKDSIWAYVLPASRTYAGMSLQFNTSYQGKEPAVFKQLMGALQNWYLSDRYMELVSKGGDLGISDISFKGRDSIQFSVVHPVSGLLYERLTIERSFKKVVVLEDLVEKYVQYQYLSKIQNHIPELSVKMLLENMDETQPLQQENGYPIFYEDMHCTLKIINTGAVPFYYGLIDMQPDRVINILIPEYGREPVNYLIKPFDSITLQLQLIPPFGIERFKIFTSLQPVELSGFRQFNRFQPTRGSNSGFYAPEVNIQTFEFELRSRAYARKSYRLTPVAKINAAGEGKTSYAVSNPSADRIYINLLKQQADGSYQLLLPNSSTSPQMSFADAEAQKKFTLKENFAANDQLVTVYADRPFNLNEQLTDGRQLNDLLLEILRNGKIAGTPLNKIAMLHELYTAPQVVAQRDGSNLSIRLITPKIPTDRGTILLAKTSSFDLAGLAYMDGNKPVKTIRINGDPVDYDADLRLFEASVKLVTGKNKITIEAADEKGFSITKILDLQLDQAGQTLATSAGKNYFLGIGIDNYQAWPQLFNATKDVQNFATLLTNKFGFAKEDMNLLLDTAATRKNIINKIRYYMAKAGPNDNVIIYLSGHGNEDQLADGDYYFIPQESDPGDVTTSVRSTDIVDNFKKIKARHCILIVDACYSGMITNAVNIPGTKMLAKDGETDLQELPSKWIITSGRATKVSDGVAGKNSPFALAFMNYLSENSSPSQLTISRVISYLKETVPKMSNQQPLGMQIDGQGEMMFKIK